MKTPKQKSKEKNNYFTQAHEDAIIKYSSSLCQREKTKLYEVYIGPAFDEMVDKIVYTYKFTTLPNIDSLREECKIWLITILDKFNKDKGSKAFSYFSVITKNWFIHKVKKQQKQNKREIDFDSMPANFEQEYMSIDDSYELERQTVEFWNSFKTEMKFWENDDMSENDIKVFKAMRVLFDSKDDIEIFNKKAIYLYLRELTGLNTKQIVNSLNKFREKYFEFKNDWDEGRI